MSDEADILNPFREVKIGGETISVRELRWSDALALLKKLSAHIGKVFTVDGAGIVKTNLTSENISEIITGSDDIALFLVEKATGRNVQWFKERSISEALEVLNIAVELNLSEQILKKGKALALRFKEVAPGAKVGASAKPTHS